jgi:serine/threonine protein kinase
MTMKLLDAVELLHRGECLHRDIAPDNVILQRNGNPVLLDFGAARRIIREKTQALTVILKTGFAPIEQYSDDGEMEQGPWTDVYALAATLYAVITGKGPPACVSRDRRGCSTWRAVGTSSRRTPRTVSAPRSHVSALPRAPRMREVKTCPR